MDRFFPIGILSAVLMLIGAPIWIGFVFGRTVICDKTTFAECLRNWLTAMSAPLAILAAVIAAWPVFEQLEDGRLATQLNLVNALKIQEDDLSGAMSALREEAETVKSHKKMLNDIIGEAQAWLIEPSKHPFNAVVASYSSEMDECKELSDEMLSKGDKDTILSKRKEIAARFKILRGDLEIARVSTPFVNDIEKNVFGAIVADAAAAATAIGDYETQYRTLNEELVSKRDLITAKRTKITDAIFSARDH